MQAKFILSILLTTAIAQLVISLSVNQLDFDGKGTRGQMSSIINGFDSPLRKFYVQVVFLDIFMTEFERFCGGAIIDDRWVVTAAQCVYGTSVHKILVHSGDFSFPGDQEETRMITHTFLPDGYRYNSGFPKNDLALLRLIEPFSDSEVLPLCEDKEDECAILGACGLGTISEIVDLKPRVLQEAYFRQLSPSAFHQCPDSNICIKTDISRMSKGDVGSPLYVMFPGTHNPDCLYGVHSYCQQFSPGLSIQACHFSNVPHYLGWMRRTMDMMN